MFKTAHTELKQTQFVETCSNKHIAQLLKIMRTCSKQKTTCENMIQEHTSNKARRFKTTRNCSRQTQPVRTTQNTKRHKTIHTLKQHERVRNKTQTAKTTQHKQP